jgi:hypothetical protein
MPQMLDGLKYWTADECAECLDIPSQLSGRLWQILSECSNKTPMGGDGSLDSEGRETVETPDGRLDVDNDDKATHWWSLLTESEQSEINKAYENY